MPTWILQSIQVAGGFLQGLSLELPPSAGLVCVIGPRGSGKSTLTEAIRHGLGGAVAGSKPRLEMLQANLGDAVITVRTAPDHAGAAYEIRRQFRQPPSVTTLQGRAIAGVDLERGTFLPLDTYNGAEIESIANESLGDKRRALVDELQGTEYRELLHAIAGHRRALGANADSIKLSRQRIAEHTERIEELGDARGELSTLPPSPEGSDLASLSHVTQQQQFNIREVAAIAAALKRAEELPAELQQLVAAGLEAMAQPLHMPGSANEALLRRAESLLQESSGRVRARLSEVTREIKEGEEELRTVAVELGRAHAEQAAQHREIAARSAEASKALQARLSAEQKVATLVGLEGQRDQARKAVQTLLDERSRLKGKYLTERERVSTAREAIAAQLEKEAGSRVHVRVLRNADDLAYRTQLLQGLKGAKVRNHDEILKALLRLRPEELAELIDQNAPGELEAQAGLGEERSRKIVEAFRASVDPFALEVVDVEDRIAIELNVGTEAQPNFKDAASLSQGQKCTALLPLLLARRETPLVIDQPEDNLDNHFIYETVVETIRRLKSKRQMVFVTHNANIPVLGEADLVVVMGSDGRKGYVAKSGSVDDCRQEIIDLLEGGREAFEKRRRRYERR